MVCGAIPAIIVAKSLAFSTFAPSIEVITSPAWMPASAAGLPGSGCSKIAPGLHHAEAGGEGRGDRAYRDADPAAGVGDLCLHPDLRLRPGGGGARPAEKCRAAEEGSCTDCDAHAK
jgi:hypothetical protein